MAEWYCSPLLAGHDEKKFGCAVCGVQFCIRCLRLLAVGPGSRFKVNGEETWIPDFKIVCPLCYRAVHERARELKQAEQNPNEELRGESDE